MRPVVGAAVYFLTVFAVGFALGVVRVSWLVPRTGARAAELMEMPLMLVAIVLAARAVARRLAPDTRNARLLVGALALVFMLAAEALLAGVLRGVSLREAFLERDPVSGTVYYASLGLFALMPWWLGRAGA